MQLRSAPDVTCSVKHPAAAQFKRGKSRDSDPYDALVLLTDTHKNVTAMLRDYERRRRRSSQLDKGKRALRICHMLSIHGAVKQEIFYPAAASVLSGKAEGALNEARVEQHTIDGLVERIEDMPARDELFDWTVHALGRHVSRQFEIEEKEVFPKLRHSRLDLRGTGELLASRQLELSTRKPDRHVFHRGKRVMRG
ncbi:MAG TPA: hemerythrin domain-containing protein [Reyranellaceae bacterium]|nr:hemerythrin domain-containing protein [Reyranellaceae bacterium]